MLSGTSWDRIHNPPIQEKVKGPATYFQDSAECMNRVFDNEKNPATISVPDSKTLHADAGGSVAADIRQKDSFKKVDTFHLEDIDASSSEICANPPESICKKF